MQQTNAERVKAGLALLRGNAELDAAAEIRLKDMFTYQYFAHESPSGNNARHAADVSGYKYVSLGENLALGIFKGDRGVVAAWMASPGHRANILKNDYEEIGVAVGRGVFEKEQTWIAVQIFARPASSCPSVDTALKTRIDGMQVQLKGLQQELVALKNEIDTMPHGGERNDKIDEYNILVNQYNALFGETKPLIAEYNDRANAYNACIGQ